MQTMAITGATEGIGAEIAKHFIANGHKVLINARKSSGWVESLGDQVKFVPGDVRERKTHQNLVMAALEWTGRLDVYINNAGHSRWRSVAEIDEAFWSTMIETNLSSTFWGSQCAAQAFEDRGGSIINISSLAGKRGSAYNAAYCAAKFGVNGLTQSLAKELGEKNIRVNAVCPVYIQTEALLNALKDENSPTKGEDTQVYLENFAKSQSALKRLPKASEVASTCLFLASDASSAITGQCINVDCGVLPQ